VCSPLLVSRQQRGAHEVQPNPQIKTTSILPEQKTTDIVLISSDQIGDVAGELLPKYDRE